MKGHKKKAAILLAAILMLAPTLVMAQVPNVQPSQKPTGEPLDIEVWTNKEEGGSFGQGENLVIYFRANRDCYVTIYDLDTKGDINLLYPYDYRDDNFIEGGVVYTIPDYYDDFVLRVNGPPGLEFVQAIASDRDFPVPDWSYNFRDPDGWREINNERDALAYLEFINGKYFQATRPYPDLDLDYAYFEVRKNWKYSWDSYYYDDYPYYGDVDYYHFYHPYYYRPIYYDPFWDPWDWCATMYIGYPYGGAIWINGIFYGYAPLFIPRVSIGWCDVRIYYHGRDYYHDRVRIRRGLSHELYHEGGFKWKTDRKADFKDNVMAQKYYPKEKSLSFKSSAKYTLGGRSGKTYKPDSRTTKIDKGTGTTYKPGGAVTKTRDSYGTKTRTTEGKDVSKGYSKTGKSTTDKSKSSTGKQTYTKEGVSKGKTKQSGSTKPKSGTYDRGTKTKSGSGSSGAKSDKTRKSTAPSARFEKTGERTAYGSSDNAGRAGSSRSYGTSSSKSSGNSGSPGYKSGTSRSRSGSSTYSRGSSSSSRSSGTYSKGSRSSGSKSSGTYSRGSSSSSSRSSGSYKGSSGSRSSGSHAGSSSKSSGGSRGSSKSRK